MRKNFGAKKIIYIFASSNYNGRGRFHAKLKNITTMKTYKANMQKTLNATANSRTLNIDTTRTFDNENAAVEQVFAWERELEANGWSIKKVDGGGITMSKLNNHNIPQSCNLFIS